MKGCGLERGVWRGDFWGSRLEKYKATAEATLTSIAWQRLSPASAFYLFAPQNAALQEEYHAGWRLTEILPVSVLGFQTHRDAFAVSFTEAEMHHKLAELADFRIP